LPQSATPEKGDVAIIQPYKGGNGIGHMTMFEGKTWYSDFKQRDMFRELRTGNSAHPMLFTGKNDALPAYVVTGYLYSFCQRKY
jgi:hypothetical protein